MPDQGVTPGPPGSPPGLQSVLDHAEAHRAEHLQRLLAYLAIPSISATGEGIAASAEHIQGVLAEVGFVVELIDTEGSPVVVASLGDDSSRPTVLVYGHYDVQPPEPLDAWTSPPFEPTVREGRVYARGAGDNKGQHLANILGVASALRVLGRLPCNVKVLLEGEEEVGSPSLARFVREHRRALDADLVIVSDGPVRPSGDPCIQFGVRGYLAFRLTARAADRDLHSGNWGGVAPNALWELIQVLASMRDADGAVTVDGFYEHVRAPSARERELVRALPIDLQAVGRQIGLRRLEVRDGEDFYRRLAWLPSLTVNGTHGGYDGSAIKAVLPHRAVATCDVRLVADQSCDDVFEKLRRHVVAASPHVRIKRWPGSSEPSATPLDTPFAEPVRRAVVAAQGAEPVLLPALGGSLPSQVLTSVLGCPMLLVPYANPDEANHAPDENLELERFFAGVRTGAAIVAHVGAMEHLPVRASGDSHERMDLDAGS